MRAKPKGEPRKTAAPLAMPTIAPLEDITAATAIADGRRYRSSAPEELEKTTRLDVAPLADVTLAAAIADGRRSGSSPLEELEKTTGLDDTALAAALAATFDYRLMTATDLDLLPPAFDLLPPAEATRHRCVVVRENDSPVVVFCDPFDAGLRPWLEARIATEIQWAVVASSALMAYMNRHERSIRAIDSALDGALAGVEAGQKIDDLSLTTISEDGSPVVKLVHSTVYDALRAGASDIHMETVGTGLVIRYRIDGVLVRIAAVTGIEVSEQVISRIKVMSELDIAERRVPQDGRFKISIDGRPIDFRVSIIPSVYGEDAVVRILDKQAMTDQVNGLTLDGLGFDAQAVAGLRRLSLLPHGMLLVTGPTGSGKTTTLYAAISETNNGTDKIVTIEDPVEYQLAGVLQIPVNEKKGLTFVRGLRSILRHDPDKIMVGEIRDPETAQIAIQSALTGHLVFTTVHANNVFDVLSRFVHMGVDPYSFVSALNGILAQRLIRVVCRDCAELIPMPPQLINESDFSFTGSADLVFRGARGCQHCRGTGYRGRKAIGELLVLDDELREAIVARVPVRRLKELAAKSGAQRIRSAAINLVRAGETTMEEANRVTTMA
jgi:general secretion pathway protein E